MFLVGEGDKHMVEYEHFNQERAVQYSAVQSNTHLELTLFRIHQTFEHQ